MKYYLVLVFLLSAFKNQAQNIVVGPTGEYSSISAAESEMSPGDTVFIQSATYSSGTQFLTVNGTYSNPIVIISEQKHGAIFDGGSEAIHLVNCSNLELNGLVIQGQTENGINIDDGGEYETPTHHIIIRDCIFQNMAGTGNNDFLKLSGLDSFLVEDCEFTNGSSGGSGIDMVGCHYGTIQDNLIDDAGVTGIQCKGGTQHILIRRNILKDMSQRAINLGGSTGLEFFRPALPSPIVDAFEAADLEVFSNVFIRSHVPIAYVGSVRVKVYNNTFYDPENWVIRILQETTTSGFLPCGDNEFRNNIVFLSADLTEVNIGGNTNASSFKFSNNLWHNATPGSWSPILPVIDSNQVIDDPFFNNMAIEDFSLTNISPAIGNGKLLTQPNTDFVQNFYDQPPSIGAFEGSSVITGSPYIVSEDCIQLFPNPSANKVRITGNLTNCTLQVLNALGQVYMDLSNVTLPTTIELEQLPNGLYFVFLKSNTHPDLEMTNQLLKN